MKLVTYVTRFGCSDEHAVSAKNLLSSMPHLSRDMPATPPLQVEEGCYKGGFITRRPGLHRLVSYFVARARV